MHVAPPPFPPHPAPLDHDAAHADRHRAPSDAPTPAPGDATRASLLLGDATEASRIIEIGPSHAPIAPKCAGWNTFVVDHADQAGLRAKYEGFPVAVDAIEEVDAVWHGGRLDQAVPGAQHGRFDRLIASHVIEHIPDPVTFLVSAQALLAPDGALALAVPDKRYCFDFLKPHSTTGDLLAAHAPDGAGRHTPRTHFQQVAYSAFADGAGAWGQHPVSQARLAGSLSDAFALAKPDGEAAYRDAHGWQFTPCAFELAIVELADGGLIDWHVAEITAAQGAEFFVILRRGRRPWPSAEAREAHRQHLLLGILAELREQIDFMALGGLLSHPSLPADRALACHLRALQAAAAAVPPRLDTLAAILAPPTDAPAAPGTLAGVAEGVETVRRHLASITDADGTQASIMGSLHQLHTRADTQQALLADLAAQLDAQNRMLASVTAPDGTQASIMGSLALLAARHDHHQQAIADTSSQAIIAGAQAIEAGRLLHTVCGRLDEQAELLRGHARMLEDQQRLLADQQRILADQRQLLAVQHQTLAGQNEALAEVEAVSRRVGRLLNPLARLRARLRWRTRDD